MTTRSSITRSAFFKFNPRWAEGDIAILKEDVEEFGGVTFEHLASGWNTFVRVCNANGDLVMEVSKGTIYYPGGRTRPGSVERSKDHSGHVFHLSPHNAGSGKRKSEPNYGSTCPRCHLAHADEECW